MGVQRWNDWRFVEARVYHLDSSAEMADAFSRFTHDKSSYRLPSWSIASHNSPQPCTILSKMRCKHVIASSQLYHCSAAAR